MIAEVTRVLDEKREEIAKDPLSVSPARLMDLIHEQVQEIHEVTSPTPVTVQIAGLRVKLPYDFFAEKIRDIIVEEGILLRKIADILPSRMRDYILIRIHPFSESNLLL